MKLRFSAIRTYHRLVFFGGDKFSETVLRNFLDRFTPEKLLVVTTSNHKLNSLVSFCRENSLNCAPWPIDLPVITDYDIGVIASFRHIIRRPILEAFSLGIINVHASLLPRWRGAAPVVYSIIAGDKTSGVSLMEVEEKVDTGDILASESVLLDSKTTTPVLSAHLACLGGNLLSKYFSSPDQFQRLPQKHVSSYASYSKLLKPEFANIDFNYQTVEFIDRLHRALSWRYQLRTSFQFRSEKLKAKLHLDSFYYTQDNRFSNHDSLGFCKYNPEQCCVMIKCLDGCIAFKYITVDCQKRISAKQFKNGYMSRFPIKFLSLNNPLTKEFCSLPKPTSR